MTELERVTAERNSLAETLGRVRDTITKWRSENVMGGLQRSPRVF